MIAKEAAYVPSSHPFVLQVVGYKNSGKTTVVTSMIHRLKQAGYTVGTIKHDAHDFTMDTPGTDTWKHQEAGADVTAISSSSRSAILRSRPEPLHSLIEQMKGVDVVLVEGFKQEPHPKLILIREREDAGLLRELSCPLAAIVWPQAHTAPKAGSSQTLIDEKSLSAIPPHSYADIPHFDIGDHDGIFTFIHSILISAINK